MCPDKPRKMGLVPTEKLVQLIRWKSRFEFAFSRRSIKLLYEATDNNLKLFQYLLINFNRNYLKIKIKIFGHKIEKKEGVYLYPFAFFSIFDHFFFEIDIFYV